MLVFLCMAINLTTTRIASIDTFRGITILVMIFVNELAGVSGLPAWMKHMPADADAMTFVDVVFPAFLFIVGMSVPFALANRLAKGDTFLKRQKHILIRTLGLLVLGVFMVNAEGGYREDYMPLSIAAWSLLFYVSVILVWNVYTFKRKEISMALRVIGVMGLIVLALIYRGGAHGDQHLSPQWWGILGLIGWAYLIACLLYQLSRGNQLALFMMTAFCIAYYCAGNSISMTDQPNRLQLLFSQTGHAAHTAIVLCGILLSLLLFDNGKEQTQKQRYIKALGFALVLVIAAWWLRPYYGISKIHSTPSWCLYCSAICTIIFLLLYAAVDLKKYSTWTNFFRPAAMNALLIYCIPFFIYAMLQVFHIQFPSFLYEGITGVIWSAIYSVLILSMAILLNRMKIKLQL